jgi:isopropylmalate/homocitrate/citramalate synthase
VSGFAYGANWTSATFLGIGERAGNAKMEEILINLQYTEGLENKYNLGCLTEFAEFMEREIGVCVPGNKAIVGKNVFVHESGIHASAVIKDPVIYEPFPPKLVGGKRRLVVGPTSGLGVITYKVNEMLAKLGSDINVTKDDHRLRAIIADIQKIYGQDDLRREASISDDEMKHLVEKHFCSL